MSNDPPLAHSARDGVPQQTYVEHIGNVQSEAKGNARRAAAFYSGDGSLFVSWVDAAAVYHDFGKLGQANQAVLRKDKCGNRRIPLPIAHEDAGVAELDRLGHIESVALVAAHHAGLFGRRKDVLGLQGRQFRNLDQDRCTPDGRLVADYIDEQGRLDAYRQSHVAAGCSEASQEQAKGLHRCGLTRRLALSCLVDADHGDTARHYGGEGEAPTIETRWEQRIGALQRYVDAIPVGRTCRERERNRLRRRVFEACRDAPIEPSIRSCDAPVGSGKTTAVMAHLLRVACEKRLRHIFVVLPYTNIITQAVEVYRRALVLDGEDPKEIVAEHHHRVDFKAIELRQLATLWKAPIVVTTAVQFFETLGSHHPSRLRKLHELPGSGVFVDEVHAAMPSCLLPQVWRWLETWTRNWGGHLVLASGSLPRSWDLQEYTELIRGDSREPMPPVPDLVTCHDLKSELRIAETNRVPYRRRLKREPSRCANRDEYEHTLNCKGLIEFVMGQPGPRLLIVNTLQTAAVIARAMRRADLDVLHLSTALAPAHRAPVVDRVVRRLRNKDRSPDWTLVATSCVEAGMDFSFHVGFRERASTASLLQIAGRVRRNDELEYKDAAVWDLLLRDDSFCQNPSVEVARQALNRFTEAQLNNLDPATLATRAMQYEWTCDAEKKARMLMKAEEGMEYPEVGKRCRVIDNDTRLVVIDPDLARQIESRSKLSKADIVRYSVQVWARSVSRYEELGQLRPIGREGELYAWTDDYDPCFVGFMAGVLKHKEFLRDNDAWII